MPKNPLPLFVLLTAVFAGLFPPLAKVCTAQKGTKIELLGAEVLKFDKSLGIDAQRLLGDVRFRHEGALMYCDSAYLYNESNSLDAFGHVRVNQGDTLRLRSDRLHYNGNTRIIKVRDNVTLSDADMTLKTHTLDYARNTGLATFYDRGFITSHVNNNELVACEGVYDSGSEYFYFRDSVVLTNPEYTMETDTLNYANRTETAYFFGPTFILSNANTIYCENGWYDTRNDVSQFEDNAYLDNGEQTLRGDSLWYDRNAGIGRAFENVEVLDTAGQFMIKGNYGQYLADAGRSLVTGRAEMIQYDLSDSLFLHGDTLLAVRDSVNGDRVDAYHGVKFFSGDMQGAADSLSYTQSDSLIRMYRNPVLWSDDLQITGDTIEIKAYGGVVDKLYVYNHAFMANRADPLRYNQIKGKRLTGYFRDNDLYKAIVVGNGESLYYAAEEEKKGGRDTTSTVTGKPSGAVGDSLSGINEPIDTIASPAPAAAVVKRDTTGNSPPPDPAAGFLADSTVVDSSGAISVDTIPPSHSGPTYIGVNKAACSSIAIYLEDKTVKRIVFMTKPDGVFYPIDRLPKEEMYFEGFDWQGDRRPKSRKDIFE